MEGTLNLWELVRQGGMAMYPLVLCSVLTLAVIGERAWVLWRVVRPGRRLTAALLGRVARREPDEARMIVRTTRTPVAEVLATAVPRAGNGHGTPGGAREAERKRQRAAPRPQAPPLAPGHRRLPRPVHRPLRHRARHRPVVPQHGGFSVVAAGISEALVATAAGLVVAIAALAAYNWFVTQINSFGAFLRFRIEELASTTPSRRPSMAMSRLPDAESGGEDVVAEINVTPLTDVFLVLLIIFMVTSTTLVRAGST